MRALLLLFVAACLQASEFEPPNLISLHPLGGKAGTAVEVEILGTHLESATGVEFDCADLTWKHTTHREPGKVTGIVWIDGGAALGGHMLHVVTAQGPSSSLLFNVGQFPAMVESEYRVIPALPIEIYGRLDGAADSDTYWFTARRGERWLFDMRAMEHGSAVESRMMLLTAKGERIAFNDDRDQYDENPLIEHTFAEDGVYCGEARSISRPARIHFRQEQCLHLAHLGLASRSVRKPAGCAAWNPGAVSHRRIGASQRRAGVSDRTAAWRVRADDVSVHDADPLPSGSGARRRKLHASTGERFLDPTSRLEAVFAIPADAATGLWRLWLAGPNGVAEGPNLEIGDLPEISEEAAAKHLPAAPYVINGSLSQPHERDVYRIAAKAGRAGACFQLERATWRQDIWIRC